MGHNAFLDLPIQATSNFGYKLDARRARRIINAYILAFLDTYLKGKKSRLLEGPSPDFPEVAFTAHVTKRKRSYLRRRARNARE